jgi:hypothetical protein
MKDNFITTNPEIGRISLIISRLSWEGLEMFVSGRGSAIALEAPCITKIENK